MYSSYYTRNFDLDKKNETITIAGKIILKWVKLQSLVANCCKMRKIYVMWSSQILYNYTVFALRGGKKTHFWAESAWLFLPRILKHKYIQNFRTSHGNIFFILQHLEINLCSFTHSTTFFLAVVLDFVLLALIKIQSIAGITLGLHSCSRIVLPKCSRFFVFCLLKF
jgi:hypothetical protein